jgi:hypothetical protein
LLATCLPAGRQGNHPHQFNVNPFVWVDVRFEDQFPKKDIGIQKNKKTPFGQEVSVI